MTERTTCNHSRQDREDAVADGACSMCEHADGLSAYARGLEHGLADSARERTAATILAAMTVRSEAPDTHPDDEITLDSLAVLRARYAVALADALRSELAKAVKP